jgi:hypothetical protein
MTPSPSILWGFLAVALLASAQIVELQRPAERSLASFVAPTGGSLNLQVNHHNKLLVGGQYTELSFGVVDSAMSEYSSLYE